jgi:hypothetical protein
MTERPKAKPVPPLAVLVAAIVLPGSGQVINREPARGLIFVFFILLLGGFTLVTAAPTVSIVGKLAGGLFVYAIAIYDAYKRARIRTAVWDYANTSRPSA